MCQEQLGPAGTDVSGGRSRCCGLCPWVGLATWQHRRRSWGCWWSLPLIPALGFPPQLPIALWDHFPSQIQVLGAFIPGEPAAPSCPAGSASLGWEGHSRILSCCGTERSRWESSFLTRTDSQSLEKRLRRDLGSLAIYPIPASASGLVEPPVLLRRARPGSALWVGPCQKRLFPSKPRTEL